MTEPRPRPCIELLLGGLPALLVLLPALTVFVRLFNPPDDAWRHVAGTLLWSYTWQTALLVVLVISLALLLGVPTAWWMATCHFRGRGVLKWALMLPLAMPGYVAALAYNDAASSMVPVYIWVRQTLGIEAFIAAQQIFRWLITVIVLGSTLFPYVYLTTFACFTQQAAGALEAARTLGVGPWQTFRRIALPMARPAIVAGASLTAFETLNDYGVVHYFGINTLTVGIFRVWLGEGAIETAIRLASLLLFFAIGSLIAEKWQRGRRAFDSGPSDRLLARRPLRGARAGLVILCCLVPLTLGFLIPATRLLRWAAQSLAGSHAWLPSLKAAWHSFSLAASGSLLIVLGALLVVASHRILKSRSLSWAQQIGSLGYAFPSALVAVGVGALFSDLAQYPRLGWLALSASAAALLFAYFTRFLAVGIQPVDAGFRRVSGTFHEAARTLGSSPWRTILRIDLPLVWPSLLAGGTLAFVDIFKELTLTLVLRPFNFETLATHIVRLTDEGRIPEAAVPALMLVAFSLLGLIPLTHFSVRRR